MKTRIKNSILTLVGLAIASPMQAQNLLSRGPVSLAATSLKPQLVQSLKPDFSDLYLGGSALSDSFELYEPELKRISRQAVDFESFSYRDPETGQPISPATVLTLPGGQKLTAAEYYRELNRHEKFLNEQGASLRSDESDLGTVQDVPDTKALLLNQKQIFVKATQPKLASPLLSDIQQMAKLNLVAGGLSQQVASEAAAKHGSKALATMLPVGDVVKILPRLPIQELGHSCQSSDQLNRSQTWQKQLGNSKFNVKLKAGVGLLADCDRVRANGEARLDGTAFKKGFNLAKADLRAEAVRQDDYALRFGIYVVGKQIYKYEKQQKNHISWGGQRSSSINKEMKFRFPVGPVRVAINIGVKGSAKFVYQIKLDGLAAIAEIRPEAHSSLYAEGGVDAWVVEGGIGGRFTLLAIELPINAKVELTPRSGKLYFHAQAYAAVELRALDGKLYAYVKVVVPRWGIPPWKKKKYAKTLVRWDGVRMDRTLFNQNWWQPVI